MILPRPFTGGVGVFSHEGFLPFERLEMVRYGRLAAESETPLDFSLVGDRIIQHV